MLPIFPLEFMAQMASPLSWPSMPAVLINLLHFRSLACFIIYLYLLGPALMNKTVYNVLLIERASKRKNKLNLACVIFLAT